VTAWKLESYADQRARWPRKGKVILAQYDDESVVVYQAFNEAIASYAVEHQRFGGPAYSRTRMTWIKPNFLWMMYRCGWLQKDPDQACVLAIRVRRAFFEELLRVAVHSSWNASRFGTRAEWQDAVEASSVRLQWDPDHGPHGEKQERRAIQLGLRGEMLARFVDEATTSIEDVSELVRTQRDNRDDAARLMLPRETVFPLDDEMRANLAVDTASPGPA